jgi:hypothetical protein
MQNLKGLRPRCIHAFYKHITKKAGFPTAFIFYICFKIPTVKKVLCLFIVSIYTASAMACTSGMPLTISAPTDSICAGDSTLICATAGFSYYAWNTGGTSQCIYAYLAGNYMVTATDNNGCTAVSNQLAINVLIIPAISVSVTGDTLHVYSGSSFQWFLNGNMIPGDTSATLIAAFPGNYTVQVVGSNGCSALSNPIDITGAALVVSLGAARQVCLDSTISLVPAISNGTAPYTYHWSSTGDSLSCYTCANPTATINRSSTYSVTVTDSTGTTAAATVSYTLATPVYFAAPIDTTVCAGSMLTITVENGFTNYHWSTGSTLGFIVVDTGGRYMVTATDGNGCTSSAFLNVVAVDTPAAEIISGTQSISPLQTYTYTVNQIAGISYQWLAEYGTVVSGQYTNSVNITWAANGPYRVGVVQTNAAGCSDTSSLLVAPLGIESITINDYRVNCYYINSSNYIGISGLNSNYDLKVYDLAGRQVMMRNNLALTQITVPENLSKGIYLLEITSPETTLRNKILLR